MLTVCANVCCKIARARYCHTKPNSRCSSVKDPKCSTGEAQNLTAPAKLRPDQYGEWYDGIIVWHQPQPCCQHFLFQRYLLVCQTHLLCAAYLQIVSHLPSMYHTSHVCVILCYSMCVSSTVYPPSDGVQVCQWVRTTPQTLGSVQVHEAHTPNCDQFSAGGTMCEPEWCEHGWTIFISNGP